jgi:hypothetical protein
MKEQYSVLHIVRELPAVYTSHKGEPMPGDLIGATIVDIGTAPEEYNIEGGGLVVDYRKAQGTDVKRIVFAFNELGMWIVSSTTVMPGTTPVSVP